VKLSHPSANTSTQTQTLVASVTTKDNLAGVARITVEGFVTVSGHTYFTRGGTLVIKTPTAKAHTYKVSFLVPKGVGSGTHTWSLLVTAVDAAGIVKSLTRAQLLAKHFTSTFKVASRTDVTPPKLTGLTFSTTSVNALSADQKVTVTVKATDSGAGVSAALVNLSTANGFTANVPPHDYAAAASPTGAIGNSVTWKATLTIPRCSDPGTWTVANVQLTDATSSPNGGAGNTATYTTGQLSTKGLPTTLDVQALDTTAPRFTTPAQAPVASPVVVTFTEPTLWTDNDLLSVEDYTAGQAPVAGTWTCRNSGATVVGCADDDADVVTATFQPSADLTSGDLYFVIAAFSPYARTKGIFDTSGNGPTQWADTFTGS
jgi:hypothetical protein